jgi:hypothetical protein
MNREFLLGLVIAGGAVCLPAARTEVAFQTVARSGTAAPGLATNVTFSGFTSFSLADDGRIAFTANISGAGVTLTNNQGLWAGLTNDLRLLARTGDPVTVTNATIQFLDAPNIDDQQAVRFRVQTNFGPKPTILIVKFIYGEKTIFVGLLLYPLGWISIPVGHVANVDGGLVEFAGPNIGATNNQAILAGPSTNVMIAAQTGFPAPGTSGNFISFSPDDRAMALAPDGSVAFQAVADGLSGLLGLWFGKAGAVQAVQVPGGAAPASLLGPGYTFNILGDTVEVNGEDQLAFSTSLTGSGLNQTNSDFAVVGPSGALRAVARSGQPAPGIPGAFFRSYFAGGPVFSYVLIGSDGTAAFVGCYSATGYDFGLWLAPANGTTPILLMRTGAPAPGTPAGVVFTNSFQFLPPFEQVYMNARNQIAFRSRLSGPGIGDTNNFGIWLAEPDGSVSLIVRAGDSFDIGGGALRQLQNVTFGVDAQSLAGPGDGRARPFNDRGEIAFWATWQNPPGPPDFGSHGQALFIARPGLILNAEKAGNDLLLSFPTLAGKHYRVDYKTNLSAAAWPVLAASVAGTGSQVTVTDSGAASLGMRFYRVARVD